jgi:hypothetical protein
MMSDAIKLMITIEGPNEGAKSNVAAGIRAFLRKVGRSSIIIENYVEGHTFLVSDDDGPTGEIDVIRIKRNGADAKPSA